MPLVIGDGPDLPLVDLWATLDKIRERPAMWIGKKSLHCLAAYIAGLHHFASNSHGNGPMCLILRADPPYDEFMRGTRDDPCGSPYSTARRRAADRNGVAVDSDESDRLGFDIWFELLDDYRASAKRG